MALALLASALASADECAVDEPAGLRTLILALDGVPLRVIEQARAQGAFEGWPAAGRLVSTFPSVTNVAFTAMFQPYGVEPARGYEVQYYDLEYDRIVGGRLHGYSDRLFAWRDTFDVTGKTVGGKISVYSQPRKKALKEFASAKQRVLETEQALVLAHIGATDAMMHLRGDDKVAGLVVEIDQQIAELKRTHLETFGRELRVIVLSDHGNTATKIHSIRGLRKSLRRAGLHPSSHLEQSNDIIAATFGIVNYGALVTDPSNAETAARAVADHPHVALAAWITGEHELSIVSNDGFARLRWKDGIAGPRYSYLDSAGDPLRMSDVVAALKQDGKIDADGYAAGDAWLQGSAASEYPDALARLTDALTGAFVANRGTVVFTMDPGYAWGWKSAYASSWIWGGRIEGTHGGLDRDSSVGFYLSDDPQRSAKSVQSVRTVLEEFAELERCRRPGL